MLHSDNVVHNRIGSNELKAQVSCSRYQNRYDRQTEIQEIVSIVMYLDLIERGSYKPIFISYVLNWHLDFQRAHLVQYSWFSRERVLHPAFMAGQQRCFGIT